jgi:hypothetical protein
MRREGSGSDEVRRVRRSEGASEQVMVRRSESLWRRVESGHVVEDVIVVLGLNWDGS